jgi:hypothetical protein
MYPHRLSLYQETSRCDMCNIVSTVAAKPIQDTYYGWYVCNNPECTKKLKEVNEKYRIPIIELKEKYGDFVIQRSNGSMENGWDFTSDAIKENEDEFWVEVTDTRGNIKWICLLDLDEWNEKT